MHSQEDHKLKATPTNYSETNYLVSEENTTNTTSITSYGESYSTNISSRSSSIVDPVQFQHNNQVNYSYGKSQCFF
jgi:hypothetical protein